MKFYRLKTSEGIIALSAHVLRKKCKMSCLNGNYKGAKEEAAELLEILGEGNFIFLDSGSGAGRRGHDKTSADSDKPGTGYPMVATNDVHYVRKEDAKAHDVLLAIQTDYQYK